MENSDLLEITAHIVAAHVENNQVPVNDVPALIASVHGALACLGRPEAPVKVKQEPAVSVRSSVKPEAIACLECGIRQKILKRHLSNAHDLTPDQYRAKWSLPADYPMVAPNYAEQRRSLAMKIGLGTKGRGKAPAGRKRKSS